MYFGGYEWAVLNCQVFGQPLCFWWLIWPIQNDAKNLKKIIETLADGYSSDSTQRELSSEYQHDRV